MFWSGTVEKPLGQWITARRRMPRERERQRARDRDRDRRQKHWSSWEASGQESLADHARNVRFAPKSTGKSLKLF